GDEMVLASAIHTGACGWPQQVRYRMIRRTRTPAMRGGFKDQIRALSTPADATDAPTLYSSSVTLSTNPMKVHAPVAFVQVARRSRFSRSSPRESGVLNSP